MIGILLLQLLLLTGSARTRASAPSAAREQSWQHQDGRCECAYTCASKERPRREHRSCPPHRRHWRMHAAITMLAPFARTGSAEAIAHLRPRQIIERL